MRINMENGKKKKKTPKKDTEPKRQGNAKVLFKRRPKLQREGGSERNLVGGGKGTACAKGERCQET